MRPRECKTANCFALLGATQNRSAALMRPLQDEHRRYGQRATLYARAPARLRRRCHQSCKHRKPVHSKATSVAKDSHDSGQCSRRAPPSQPNTATSLVSKPPTVRSLQQSSALSRCTEIQPWLRNSSQMFADPNTAKLRLEIARPRQNHACDVDIRH